MRTTLNIEEEALAYAKARSRATGKSLGAVVSQVLLEAASPRAQKVKHTSSGIHCLPKGDGSRVIQSDEVESAMEQEEQSQHAIIGR